MAQKIVSVEGDMLDLMVWRATGRAHGVFEAVLEANPGAADLPLVLPQGVVLTIPDEAMAAPARHAFKLWE